MKIWICSFVSFFELGGNDEEEYRQYVMRCLNENKGLKFVLAVGANLQNESLALCVGIGPTSMKHLDIEERMRREMRAQKIFGVGTPELGGGELKKEGNKLVFFSSSFKKGPYDELLLRKAEEDIRTKFRVSAIEYLTDCHDKKKSCLEL